MTGPSSGRISKICRAICSFNTQLGEYTELNTSILPAPFHNLFTPSGMISAIVGNNLYKEDDLGEKCGPANNKSYFMGLWQVNWEGSI
jgi:hypothetical protein